MSSQLVGVGRTPSIQGCIIKARNRKGGDKWITQKENVKRFQCSVRQTFFLGKKDAKPVGWMSDPDEPGPVIVDRKTLESLLDDKSSGADAHSTDEETIDDNKQTRKERTYVSHR